MLRVTQIVAVLLVAVVMSMSLAHALELPGKKRLDKETYLAVQAIYYPGFTIGGLLEPLSIIATLLCLFMTRHSPPGILVDPGSMGWQLWTMHAIFWTVTQPVNKFWLKNQQLKGLGKRFFSTTDPIRSEIRKPMRTVKIRKGCGIDGNIRISREPCFLPLRSSH